MDFNEACLNLNLTPIFTSLELKKQYRMMSLKYHPDKHMPDTDGFYSNKFKIIAESYQYLHKYPLINIRQLFSIYQTDLRM